MQVAINYNKENSRLIFSPKSLGDFIRSYNLISIFSNEGLLPTVAEVVLSTWSAKPLDQKFLDESPSIKLLIHAAGSVHHLVTPALVERGIRVTSAAHLNAIPTAEFALALILTALRNTLAFTSRINAGGHKGWKKPKKNDFLGYYGTRVGLLGFGNVTLHLLKLLQHFDIECYVADPFVDPVVIRNLGATPACLDWVIEHCDVVSLHHASRQNTRHLLNRERISRLKPGAQLINTARGALIDETALVDRLKQGDIHAYLDVTEKEPPPEDHPFYTLPNCQLTPHIAGSLGREVHRFGEFALRELDNWIHQRPLEGEVDLATLSNRG